jgi:hypothetical protein
MDRLKSISKLPQAQFIPITMFFFIPKILLYIWLIPPWQVPDEPTHFEYVYLLSHEKNPLAAVSPNLELQEKILQSMNDFRFWSYLPFPEPSTPPKSFEEDYFLGQADSQIRRSPPLYYVIGSRWLRLFSPATILEALYLLRLYSALLTSLFVLTIVILVHWAFPYETELKVGALCFVLFLPQLAFVGGGVNSDNLINLFYAAAVVACIKVSTGKSARWLGLLILLTAACLLTKKTGLAAVPLAAFSLLLAQKQNPNFFVRGVAVTAFLLGALLLGHVLLTWFSPEDARKIVRSVHFAWTNLTSTPRIGGDQSLGVVALVLWQSFWASFGWLRVGPPFWLYLPTLAVHIVMVAGATLTFKDAIRAPTEELDRKTERVRTILSFSGILILAAVLLRNLNDFQPQGRYLLPALPAFALWFAMGLSLVPSPTRKWVLAVFVSWFCIFELATLFGYATPIFCGGTP